jgi:hypothetical protein
LKIWAYKIINNENPTNRPSSEIRWIDITPSL